MNTRISLRFVFLTVFVLVFAGWLRADTSHARIIRLSLVQGDVRFTRDVHGDPLTSDKATWEGATLNLPIRQGYVLATDQGRAEVEFENGAMAFLAENTVLEFYDLSLEDGAKTTRLVLRQGTASFYVNPGSGDYFSVTGGERDHCGAAIHELALLQLRHGRPLHVRLVVPDRRIRKLLAAVRSGTRLVTLRERRLVYGSDVRLVVHRRAAVGLVAVSLWGLGIRPVFWMVVVAGIWIRSWV